MTSETLFTYASIFRKWRRDPESGTLRPPSEVCEAAANALSFHAILFDLAADSRISSEIIGIRVRNEFADHAAHTASQEPR